MPLSRVINVLLFCAALVGSSAGVAAVTAEPAPSAAAGGRATAPGTDVAAVPPAASAAGTPAARKPAQRATRAGRAEPAAAPAAAGGAATPGPASAPEPAAAPVPGPEPVDGPAGGGLMYIGTTTGGYDQAVAATGGPLARHAYAEFGNRVPEAEMISVSAGGTPWRQVAAARPGTALGDQIVRWAQTIAARPGTVMLNYNHEPEADDRHRLGSAAEFIAAWRNVRTIFDQQGARNIEWTWQVTAWSFAAKPGSVTHAAAWYPGDAWVDNIGADSYSWNGCGSNSSGYRELAQIADPVLAFARAHGKKASFPEFGIHAVGGDRARWLDNAHRYLVANRDVVTAAFYFNRGPTTAKNATCSFTLTAADEYAEIRGMAQDTAHFRV